MRREASTRQLRAAAGLACASTLALAALEAPPDGGAASPPPSAQRSIVGGSAAPPASWRFAAALFFGKRLLCSASVIAPTEVLTAAHCVVGLPASRLGVVVERPRLGRTGVGERIPVARKRVHPAFRRNQRHDLAVLTLASATSAPSIEPATPEESRGAVRPRSRLRVAGWGSANPFGIRTPGVLKQAAQWVLRNRRCLRSYRRWAFSGRTMICATGRLAPRWSRRLRLRIGVGPCFGDSGGPLVADTPDGPRQVGVVSFGGFICGARSQPAVYARVASAFGFVRG
jgi:secreted trypsin-like serine protease